MAIARLDVSIYPSTEIQVSKWFTTHQKRKAGPFPHNNPTPGHLQIGNKGSQNKLSPFHLTSSFEKQKNSNVRNDHIARMDCSGCGEESKQNWSQVLAIQDQLENHRAINIPWSLQKRTHKLVFNR